MVITIKLLFLIFLFPLSNLISQILPDCYNFTYSHLELDFLIEEGSIQGSNEMYFEKRCISDTIKIELAQNLIVDSVLVFGSPIAFIRHDNQIIIYDEFLDSLVVKIFYHGFPLVSDNPPWQSGFVFDKDKNGRDWVGVACQLSGASLWWPNEGQLYDEPDSMRMTFTVPDPYMAISNGRLIQVKDNVFISDSISSSSYEWFVSSSINNYNITVNIGVYSHFQDYYDGLMDSLSLDYYVLPYHMDIAEFHFKQCEQVLSVFEELFGPYPFYDDGYKLVETSYLGMEHQSCISYGNKFKKGYLGQYPLDIDFDFIIVHESGHEWWGNNISMETINDMWIHESFCTYSEALYVEEIYGYNKMIDYLNYQKKNISNLYPIIGSVIDHKNSYNLNMYYKGSWMLHTLRQCINNDDLWFGLLKSIQFNFKHQTLNTYEMIQFINNYTNLDLTSFFNIYLNDVELPSLKYKLIVKDGITYLQYKWSIGFSNLQIPIHITLDIEEKIDSVTYWVLPSYHWKELNLGLVESEINFIGLKNVLIEIEK